MGESNSIPAQERLSARHKALVDHYLTDAYFNKTKAGALVGIKQPQIEAWRILNKPRVKKYLDERLEALGADKAESLVDLARMSRGAMQYFFNPKTKEFDFESETAIANLDLIKSMVIDEETKYTKEGEPIVRKRIKVDVIDKLAARTVLAKVQGLLRENEGNVTINQSLTVNNVAQVLKDNSIELNELIKELPDVIRMLQPDESKVIEQEVTEQKEETPTK